MLFKIGDKVKIVKISPLSVFDKTKYIGKIYTVKDNAVESVFHPYPYRLINDESGIESEYLWAESELELVKSAPFTKADLLKHMVVKTRVGIKYIVVDNILMGYDCYIPLNEFNNDLKHESDNRLLDIVEVYETSGWCFTASIADKNLTLIWKRNEEPQPKEMTVKE